MTEHAGGGLGACDVRKAICIVRTKTRYARSRSPLDWKMKKTTQTGQITGKDSKAWRLRPALPIRAGSRKGARYSGRCVCRSNAPAITDLNS